MTQTEHHSRVNVPVLDNALERHILKTLLRGYEWNVQASQNTVSIAKEMTAGLFSLL